MNPFPTTQSMNISASKWVIKIKQNPDGTTNKYKVRLVAKNAHQNLEINFKETFNPIIKPTTIRLVLSIAVTYKWPIRQMDVNNVFLNRTLTEEVLRHN